MNESHNIYAATVLKPSIGVLPSKIQILCKLVTYFFTRAKPIDIIHNKGHKLEQLKFKIRYWLLMAKRWMHMHT